MAEIKKDLLGIEINGTLKGDIKLNQMVEQLCSQLEIEYIGKRVNRERRCINLIRYENELYYEVVQLGYGLFYTIKFTKFLGEIEDTEPVVRYKYYIEYYDKLEETEEPNFLYFKEEELNEAKEMQQKLGGKDFAELKELQ